MSSQARQATAVVRRLREEGHAALLAGGCVRDLLLGREPRDFDVATSARPEEVQRLFARTIPVGAAFGVILVVENGARYEVATFRRDGPSADGRRPSGVTFVTAEEDAQRRDFTINGLFLDPLTGEILDHVGGQADLERRIVRAIGDPAARFEEDRLRLLRAVRFAAGLDFEIEPGTADAIRDAAPNIHSVSAERIDHELTRILTDGSATRGFVLLHELGLLREVLPEVEAMVGVRQPPEFHPEGDVWTHLLAMLEGLDRMAVRSKELAFGILLHDVGKPVTYEEADRIRFNDHARVGAEMADEICRRLRMSRAERERIVDLVRCHMTFLDVRRMRPGRLRRFLGRERIEEHLELHRLDCESSHGSLENHEHCRRELETMRSEPPPPPRLLTGKDLIAEGLTPGPAFAEILRDVEEAQLEHRISTRDEALCLVRDRLGDSCGPGRDAGDGGA